MRLGLRHGKLVCPLWINKYGGTQGPYLGTAVGLAETVLFLERTRAKGLQDAGLWCGTADAAAAARAHDWIATIGGPAVEAVVGPDFWAPTAARRFFRIPVGNGALMLEVLDE